MFLQGFKEIIKKLGIGSSSNPKHETDGHGHDHAHKRRSLNKLSKRASIQSTVATEKVKQILLKIFLGYFFFFFFFFFCINFKKLGVALTINALQENPILYLPFVLISV